MRARGLKQARSSSPLLTSGVAPHAGAWIETCREALDEKESIVAPHAGAWIETIGEDGELLSTLASRPMRARGLKLFHKHTPYMFSLVAPHAGAWIETLSVKFVPLHEWVAPHAGAWIETISFPMIFINRRCRAPCGRVD